MAHRSMMPDTRTVNSAPLTLDRARRQRALYCSASVSTVTPVGTARRKDEALNAVTVLGISSATVKRQDDVVWRYPADALPEGVEYAVEIEADEPGLWVLVVRDRNDVPQAIGIMTGDDRTDTQTLLALWGLDRPDVPDEPPAAWT